MKKTTGNRNCPRCGSLDTVRIVLGQPRPDLPPRGPQKKDIPSILGGGGVDNPDRVCRKCGHQWRAA
jgi:ribosomal protein S27AE